MREFHRVIQNTAIERKNQPSWAHEPRALPRDLAKITQQTIDVYLLSKQYDGGIRGIDWWQWANGYTAIALHDLSTGSEYNYATVSEALRQCERLKRGFANEFLDDTLWWALCCFHMYSFQHDEWFLQQAQGAWNRISNGNSICRKGEFTFQGMDMEGACFWTRRPDEEQINSITTGLFAELSVRLALLEQASESLRHLTPELRRTNPTVMRYLDAARRGLGWILRCRYNHQEAVVLDNILVKQQRAQNWKFTYTTGVTIGVCGLMYEATREEEYLTLACTMAKAAMRRREWVEENGVLTERGAYGKGSHEPWKNNDAVGFKAVLMRHLALLVLVVERTKSTSSDAIETAALIRAFVNVNLHGQLERNTNGQGQYGPWWNGPFETPTSHSQMAVLDVMAAIRSIDGA